MNPISYSHDLTFQTYKVDRDACIHYINAASRTPSITRFLLVSYNGSRRQPAPWWADADPDQSAWAKYEKEVNYGALADYYQAKIAADEALYRASRGRGNEFVGINLRPTTLTQENSGGVELGKVRSVKGNVGREKVAKVADALLAADGIKSSWIDLADGDDDVKSAVQAVVSKGIDTVEGEPVAKE